LEWNLRNKVSGYIISDLSVFRNPACDSFCNVGLRTVYRYNPRSSTTNQILARETFFAFLMTSPFFSANHGYSMSWDVRVNRIFDSYSKWTKWQEYNSTVIKWNRWKDRGRKERYWGAFLLILGIYIRTLVVNWHSKCCKNNHTLWEKLKNQVEPI
jgi:hypothetical protein